VKDFATAAALALALEGLAYAAFPDAMKRMLSQVMEMPPAALRFAGLAAAVLGIAVVAVLRQGVAP